MRTFKQNILLAALVATTAVGASGCMDWWPEFGIPASGNKPFGEWNPLQQMHSLPSYKDQEAGANQYVPPMTVSTGFRPNTLAANDAAKATELENPVPVTAETLKYGKLMYDTTCIVCHGPAGKGNGYVVTTDSTKPKYPMPPDINSSKLRNWKDGQIYHVISHGQGRMWSYKSQLKPMERWAVVNYVRALQRADYPESKDLAQK